MHRITWDTSRGSSTSLTRLSQSMADSSKSFSSHPISHIKVPQPRRDKSLRFGLFRFRSPLLTESLRFLFLRLLRCFTSPGLALTDYEFIRQYPAKRDGFPHSEIHGSKPVCGSPWLIAAYHVLHRLLAPRHSPLALSSLITNYYYSLLASGFPRTTQAIYCCPVMCAIFKERRRFRQKSSCGRR